MRGIYTSIEQLIGGTPLLELGRIMEGEGLNARLLAKLESFNPGGSAKDRPALAMIEDAEARGILKPGSTIIEPTSGNTGIGLAMVAAVRGYKVIIVMPDNMSVERQILMSAYGAQVILTPGEKGMTGAIQTAKEIAAETPDSFIPGQFENPVMALANERTTGPEIWEDTEGKVDIFVAGVGTGGTLTGTARYLKEQNPNVKVVAVEPAGSPFLTKGVAGPHAIAGIGAGFVPAVLDTEVYDEVMPVTDEDALTAGRMLAKTEGVLAGISSGAALWAAMEQAKRPENAGKNIVVLLADTGERYLSSALFRR